MGALYADPDDITRIAPKIQSKISNDSDHSGLTYIIPR
jgi:hypothetical protein